MSTKKQREKIVSEKLESETDRVLQVMRDANIYDKALDPLLESYLDIFEIYQTMFVDWKDKGFPSTQTHTNKNGSKNKIKHPLSQQVEVWADKKTKALEMLGLSNKGNKGIGLDGGSSVRKGEKMERPEYKVSQLDAHRDKWRNKAGG